MNATSGPAGAAHRALRVDVALTPAEVPASLDGLHVVVLDVVRAMTSTACALAHGATSVLPVAGLESARALAHEHGALLAGERDALPPEGFDLGNSPGSFDAATCAGREIVLTTTNGTRAVRACAGAARLLGGALVNAEATARALVRGGAEQVLIVCAGSGGALAADDVAAAGCLAGSLALLGGAEPGDGARVAAAFFDAWRHDLPGLLRRSLYGRRLARVGLTADIEVCARVDSVPVVVELDREGRFRKLG
jgi:2-phosphosulfolactate phosphatase